MEGSHLATANAELDADSIRVETLEGRDHLVAPVVAVREMVLKGELLPQEEIEASVPAWNGRVLPIGHPTDESGEFVSANSPTVHNEQTVGRFFEADTAESSLVGEIWVDVDESKRLATEQSDERFVKPLAILASHANDVDAANIVSDSELPEGVNVALNADDVLEVSTAYFYRRRDAMGTHDGQSYDATQHDIQPDHLALLPNAEGECSAEDGCGAPRAHVHANVSDDPADDGGAADDGGGDRSVETPSGEQVSIANYSDERTMDYDIDSLASNTEFDRETLESFDDEHLAALSETVDSVAGGSECGCGAAHDDEEAQNSGDSGVDGDGDGRDSEIAALREEIEELREERQRERRKAEYRNHAATIVAHSDKFDDVEEVLAAFDDDEALVALAEDFEKAATAASAADFSGRVGANRQPGASDDDDLDDYKALVKEANPARFGEPGGDD